MMHLVEMPQDIKSVLDIVRQVTAKIVGQEEHQCIERHAPCTAWVTGTAAQQIAQSALNPGAQPGAGQDHWREDGREQHAVDVVKFIIRLGRGMAPDGAGEIAAKKIAVPVAAVNQEDHGGQEQRAGEERPVQERVVLLEGKKRSHQGGGHIEDNAL